MTELQLEPLSDLTAARDEWTQLAERAGNLFATWEWADAWWGVFGDDRPLFLTACRDRDERLAGILPLYLATGRPVRTLRFIGQGPADQLGPVCAPEDRRAVASALLRLLHERARDWDVLLAERLAPAEGWGRMLGGKLVRHEESPSIEVAGRSFDEYLASRSGNFRQQVRRRERKLGREHALEFRLATAATLDADLDALFGLHAARWSEGESEALAGARRDFHRDFARRALERGWLRLWLLELDGERVAAWYGFRYAGADWYYQSGRDPERDHQSVGFVLLAHTIRQAFDDGMREYRLLRGGEDYKDRFASTDDGVETVALTRGLAGRGALLAARAARSMPSSGRRRLVKLAG